MIETKRGKRLNVLAALVSTGEVISAKLWQSTTAEAFSGFLELLKNTVQKPLTVILDNASIHKAKSLEPIVKYLKIQGGHIVFLAAIQPRAQPN